MNNTEDGWQNCCRLSVSAVVVTLVIFYQISSKFHVWIASIKLLFKFEYKFSQTNDNQDDWQNGRRLSNCFCGQSTLIIYYLITSKFYTWITFIKLSVCQITKMAATYQFTLVDTLTSSFITQFLPNFIYWLLSSNYCSCLNMGISPFCWWALGGALCQSPTVLVYSTFWVQTVPQNIYHHKSFSSFWSPDFEVKSKWTLSLNPKLNNPK